jgi:hypothetical protein
MINTRQGVTPAAAATKYADFALFSATSILYQML